MRRQLRSLFPITLILSFCCAGVGAQQWDGPVRGSWVREGRAQRGDVTLTARGRGCEIVVAGNENSAVRQAAQFLAGDIVRISGYRPPVLAASTGRRSAIHLITAGGGPIPLRIGAHRLAGLWEAHRIVTQGRDVWLVGSNFRGTAFAAYTLGERLGIDPLYHWTGYEPERHPTLVLRSTDYYAPPPTFRFRGLFHDDEDILPRPLEGGVPSRNGTVPTVWYQRYFETALRLRMNQVAPFVRVRRPFEVQKLASDWGLFYTSHHYDVLLSNPYGYDRFNLARERGVTGAYDWFANKDMLLRYWRAGVLENRELNCIWPVGLRGTEDQAQRFPAGTTEEQKARAFAEAIAAQVRMTRELLPADKEPLFHFTMYGEMLRNYQQGRFDVPGNVMLVWDDNGDGIMRALPQQPGQWKHGVYYHLAFFGGSTKQTHHTVQPARIEGEFRKIVAAGATEYMLVNVSELREFVMEARLLAEIGWDAPTAFARPDAADRYVQWWATEYFGRAAAGAAAQAYQDYYRLIDRYSSLWVGSDKVVGAAGSLQKKLAGQPFGGALPETLPMLEQRAAQYETAMKDVAAASAQMDARQQQFFFEHVTLGLLMDYRPTQAALLLVKAMNEPDRDKCLALCRQALVPLAQLERELARAERPPFERWYGVTWIRRPNSPSNPHRSYDVVRTLLDSVATGTH